MTDQNSDALTALYEQYPVIIEQMSSEFTSHEFIQKLTQQNQTLYVEALYAYRFPKDGETASPFQTVHGFLAKKLHDSPLVMKLNYEVDSRNIFGHYTKCANWRKVS